MPGPVRLRIPAERDELELDEQAGGIPFVLKGWVRQLDCDTEGIDSADPLRYQLRKEIASPGTLLVEQLGLEFDPGQFRSYRRGCPEPVEWELIRGLDDWLSGRNGWPPELQRMAVMSLPGGERTRAILAELEGSLQASSASLEQLKKRVGTTGRTGESGALAED